MQNFKNAILKIHLTVYYQGGNKNYCRKELWGKHMEYYNGEKPGYGIKIIII